MKRFFIPLFVIFSMPAAAQTIVLEDSACRAIVQHQPADDVTYQPGIDTAGNPVVGADLNPSPIQLPETISFDITVDVMKYAGIAPPKGVEGQAVIGRVDINKDGRMYFNGQPMEGQAEASLRALCKDKPPVKQGETPHVKQGEKAGDTGASQPPAP